jgi:hypothetical protein
MSENFFPVFVDLTVDKADGTFRWKERDSSLPLSTDGSYANTNCSAFNWNNVVSHRENDTATKNATDSTFKTVVYITSGTFFYVNRTLPGYQTDDLDHGVVVELFVQTYPFPFTLSLAAFAAKGATSDVCTSEPEPVTGESYGFLCKFDDATAVNAVKVTWSPAVGTFGLKDVRAYRAVDDSRFYGFLKV